MTHAFSIENYLASNRNRFEEISTFIWQHPETRYLEFESSRFLADEFEKEGFTVQRGIGGIETAFSASFGEGKPVIGFLGEFDALAGLSQKAHSVSQEPLESGSNGHGCGHNLLGTGSLAAAYAVKSYFEENGIKGTIVFYGCPAEEGGSGKTFMVREGVFDGLDAAFTWHPSYVNTIMSLSSLANYQVYFRFKGIASHAANSPHLGRSALDAVELMNVGVNYLREHVIPEARMHYAITNSGGISPNVVQSEAEVLYLIRAPKVAQVDDIYKRVCKIAEGAALMTETEMSIVFDKACSNYEPNRVLESILFEKLQAAGPIHPTAEETTFAQGIWDSLSDGEKKNFVGGMESFGYSGDGSEFEGKFLSDIISGYEPSDKTMPGSTDVSDVSWVVPTAQLTAATSALGTPLHTWQMVTQGLSTFAHSGTLLAARTMAEAAIHLFENGSVLEAAKTEHEKRRSKEPYTNPIPQSVKPSATK